MVDVQKTAAWLRTEVFGVCARDVWSALPTLYEAILVQLARDHGGAHAMHGRSERGNVWLALLSAFDGDAPREVRWGVSVLTLWHQGTIYDATAHAVPFLVALTRPPGPRHTRELAHSALVLVLVMGSALRERAASR